MKKMERKKFVLFESLYVDGKLITMQTRVPQSVDGAKDMIEQRSQEIIKECVRLHQEYEIVEDGATSKVISISVKGIEHSFRLASRL